MSSRFELFWFIFFDANSYILSFRKSCWANFPFFHRENIIQTEGSPTFWQIFPHGISREWTKSFGPKIGPLYQENTLVPILSFFGYEISYFREVSTTIYYTWLAFDQTTLANSRAIAKYHQRRPRCNSCSSTSRKTKKKNRGI